MRERRTLAQPSREEAKKGPIMPLWLEILLNLSGYAGFVALAATGVGCPDDCAKDHVTGDER